MVMGLAVDYPQGGYYASFRDTAFVGRPFLGGGWNNPYVFNNTYTNPWGVAVDVTTSYVYTTDLWRCNVQVIDINGDPVRTWGECGDWPGAFLAAAGIALTSTAVFVADPVRNIVQVRLGIRPRSLRMSHCEPCTPAASCRGHPFQP